jgi:hypothetical protein
MWFSGLRETNWKPFEAFSFFFLENDSWGLVFWGFPGDGGTGDSRWELPRLPLALNHVEVNERVPFLRVYWRGRIPPLGGIGHI